MIRYDLRRRSSDSIEKSSSPLLLPRKLFTVLTVLSYREIRASKIPSLVASLPSRYQRPTAEDKPFHAGYEHIRSEDNVACEKCDARQRIAVPEREANGLLVYYGQIASVDQAVDDAELRDDIASQDDAWCIEQDAAILTDTIPSIHVRGIATFCDSHSNQRWIPYAQATATAYAKEFLGEMDPADVKSLPLARAESECT